MLLLCSFFRLKELFQVKNGVTTSLLFFFENAKNLGRSDDGKGKKKEDGLMQKKQISLDRFYALHVLYFNSKWSWMLEMAYGFSHCVLKKLSRHSDFVTSASCVPDT